MSSLILITIVPIICFGILFLVYTTSANAKVLLGTIEEKNSKARSIVYWLSMLLLVFILVGYIYYTFIQLHYFSQFGNAIFGVVQSIVYLLFSPFFFLYFVFSVDNLQHDLIINTPELIRDIKSWFAYKFGIHMSDITKNTFLVMAKILTLIIFSTKIINVSKFLLFNLFKLPQLIALLGAFLIFISLAGLYAGSHYDELLKVFQLTADMLEAFMKGGMR
jgi:hypothetical protein